MANTYVKNGQIFIFEWHMVAHRQSSRLQELADNRHITGTHIIEDNRTARAYVDRPDLSCPHAICFMHCKFPDAVHEPAGQAYA
jgi:hypothetical protein